MSNNEEQNGKLNRRQGSEYNNDPDYRVNAWDEMNGEDKFVQSAIQEEFNNPVIEETILKFNKIANEEEKET
ncbi:hypothetical protein Q8G35_26015 [Peribacillus simplex]|uniref:Uncharacterized protein n=2 Tax=Peribacillus TaxID=2675229 RepID=A0AA90T8Z5_9BACI|nr:MULTISPECIES: hypothetical protein [Peribacillus]MDP1421725.1 hypothetical protein [Peribacillus simplex]MDP1454422.1 hypothetical protein [Peribacillus frigoritolerans]